MRSAIIITLALAGCATHTANEVFTGTDCQANHYDPPASVYKARSAIYAQLKHGQEITYPVCHTIQHRPYSTKTGCYSEAICTARTK